MQEAYLYVNAALYFVLAAWSTLSPWRVSHAVGYGLPSSAGRSEFLVIYGGLQFGLALFFLLAARSPALHSIGVVFACALYAPIVIYRAATLVAFRPVEPVTAIVGALELVLLIAGGLLLRA